MLSTRAGQCVTLTPTPHLIDRTRFHAFRSTQRPPSPSSSDVFLFSYTTVTTINAKELKMSGLEVAGLALGAFPIAIEILGKYREVARRLGFWYKIAAEHKKCDSQLKFHKLLYVSNLKKLLLPLAGLDDTHIDEMLQNPGGKCWSEARTAEYLEKRLGDSHEIYLQCMAEFKEWLQAMNHHLAFDVASKQSSRESTPSVSSMCARELQHSAGSANNRP